jgi:ribosome-associated toxin RatA of RatAB toxin-antitoxin module
VFTTRNLHDVNRRVGMSLVNGPFSNLEGAWTFSPVGASDTGEATELFQGSNLASDYPSACRVSLSLQYGFDNHALQAVVGPVFDRIANSLVDAFVKRAVQVYG